MLRGFRAVFLLCMLGGQATAQHQAISADQLEQRIETWRDLLRAGHQQAVADSCQHLLRYWPRTAPPRLQALVWSLQGNALRQSGHPDSALPLHRQALRLRQQVYGHHHPEVASSLQNISNCLLDLGDSHAALPLLRRAATIKEYYFKNDPTRLLSTYTSLGQCLTSTGDYPAAARYLRTAIHIESRISGNHSPEMAPQLLSLADLYTAEQRYDSCIAVLQRARRLPLDTLGQHHQTYILLLNNLGNAYAAWGQPTEAQTWLHQAISRCDDRPGQTTPQRGRALLNLGNCQYDLGDFATAETTLRAARHYLVGYPTDEAACLNILGLTLRYRDRSAEAIDTFLQAYNRYLQTTPAPAHHRALAGTCMNLASAYLDQAAYTEANFYLQKALRLYLRLPGSTADRSACYDKMGLLLAQQGDLAAAHTHWIKALALSGTASPSLRFSIRLHQADAFARQHQWPAAEAAYQQAAAALAPEGLRQGLVFPYETAQWHTAKARTALWHSRYSGKATDWATALSQARDAIAMLAPLRGQMRTEQSVLEMQSVFDTPYDIAVEAALALGQTALAWEMSECLKSRLLNQWSTEASGAQQVGAASEQRRIQRLAYFQHLRSKREGPQWVFLDDSIRHLTEAGFRYRQMLERTQPRQAQWMWATQPPDLTTVRQHLQEGQSLLAYHWGRERAWAFVLRTDTLVAAPLVWSDSLRLVVERFFRHCSTNPYGVADNERHRIFREICLDGLALYQHLVQPLEGSLTPSVLVIPDGWLCFLPFEALLVSADTAAPHRFHRHRFWAKQHHIAYAHSATSWVQVKTEARRSARQSLLAIAPSFEQNPHGLKPLRHNAAEADSVRALSQGKSRIGSAATRQQFEAEADQYRVLLLSTHGVMDNQQPLSSFIGFYAPPGQADSADQSLMRVADVYGLHLSADLVVLSACQTASGHLYRGGGVQSLARAFQYVGAKSLVASLWNVDDRNTPVLMRTFFGLLWKNLDKPTALTTAKRRYLDRFQGLDAHPYYWAGLVGIGDDAPLSHLPPERGWKFWLLLSAAAAILIVIAKVWQRRWPTERSHTGK